MAGEVEEPFGFNIQLESLHSGSISFGRFEKETLYWERRSSFSHNRYLEEVEKFSKPGSVTEKKAYFEAHFKKKALVRQGSSENQQETGHQTSGHNISANMIHKEEFELVNDCSSGVHFDNSLDGSDYYAEHEGTGSERDMDNMETSAREKQLETAYNNADAIVENYMTIEKLADVSQTFTSCNYSQLENAETTPAVETRQTVIECEYSQSDSAELEVDAEGSLNDAGEESGAADLCLTSHEGEETNITLTNQATLSPQSRGATKAILPKLRGKSHVTVTSTVRSHSNQVIDDSTKKLSRREKLNLMQTRRDKHILSAHQTPPNSSRSTLKPVSNIDSKEKISTEGKRSTGSSNKIATKSNPTVFSFRSEERAERRKEFHAKMEEKMHAKETEINQIQAEKQEKTEAEIKQLRRSLNFKATPLPSFYHQATKPATDKNKGAKLSQYQGKRSNSRTRASALSSNLKAGSDMYHSADVSKSDPDTPQASDTRKFPETKTQGGRPTSPASSASKGHSPSIDIIINGPETEEQYSEKDMDLKKHGESAIVKGTKDQRTGIRGSHKDGIQRSKLTDRKDMKAGEISDGSRMGRVAVGVAC